MISRNIAYRYANALYQLGGSKDEQSKRASDLLEIIKLIDAIPHLRSYVLAPQFGKEEKKNILQKSLGTHVDQKLLKFLFFLIEKGRLQQLAEITAAFKHLLAEQSRILDAKLITAAPINSNEKNKLKEKLEKAYGKEIRIEEALDPALLGGMIVLMNSKMMDCSIKNRLEKLKTRLKNSKVGLLKK